MQRTKPSPVTLCALAALMASCGGGGSGSSISSPDFSISATPSSSSVQQGATSAPVTVTVTGQSGFTGSVSVSIQGLPQNVSSSPASPFSVSAGANQGVTFSASASATAGNVPITFSATSGALAHIASATLRGARETTARGNYETQS